MNMSFVTSLLHKLAFSRTLHFSFRFFFLYLVSTSVFTFLLQPSQSSSAASSQHVK